MTESLFPFKNPSLRPITFTSGSIEKIERDLKTQTRRTMYPQPAGNVLVRDPENPLRWRCTDAGEPSLTWRCPYGIPGDRLWVRQVWARVEPFPGVSEDYGMPVAWRVEKNPVLLHYWRQRVIFLSDFRGKQPADCGRGASDNVWRGPGTMPRWAARCQVEVTEIRAERVQQISTSDAIAEGVDAANGTPQKSFAFLWDSINGHKNPWTTNCWVWAVSFRRIVDATVGAV